MRRVVYRAECQLCITVEDTGIGIAADKIDHVFGEFNQVEDDRNRQFEGTGLGLAITKRLVELMGGKIWVTSREGSGSCFGFSVKLPVEPGYAGQSEMLDTRFHRILVVEETSDKHEGSLVSQIKALGGKPIPYSEAVELTAQFLETLSLVVLDLEAQNPAFECFTNMLDKTACDTPLLFLSQSPKTPIRIDYPEVHSRQRPYARAALFDAITSVAVPREPENTVPTVSRITLPRVLLAEDNRTNQLVFRKMVSKMDIALEVANDGFEAVAAFEANQPDVIFMDISMPGMDGKEATARIRALEGNGPNVPIIAVTAHAMDGDHEMIIEAGLTDYLTKPLRKDALIEKLKIYCPQLRLAS